MIEIQPDKEKATKGSTLEQFQGGGPGLIIMGGLIFALALGAIIVEGFGRAGAGTCFVALGLFMMAGGFFGYVIPRRNRNRVRRRLDPITLRASADRARVGEPVRFELEAHVQQTVTVEVVRMALMFREWAEYKQGTDTRHDETEWVIAGEQAPGGTYQTGQVLHHTLTGRVPPNAMHTFFHSHNRCTWLVKVQIVFEELPDFEAEYPLIVTSALAETGG